MFPPVLSIVVCLLALAGCAGQPIAAGAVELPWRDGAFEYNPALVTVNRDELFRLDPQLQAKIQATDYHGRTAQQKLKQLLALVFGEEHKTFGYVAGHSTTASATWSRQRGDCLSLTVLTYAVARAMDMDAEMQEVRVPTIFDRRGQLDVINQHVNVLFRRAHRNLVESAQPHDVVVDFEPQYVARRKGRPLSEDGMLARYYNNVAAEYLAQGKSAQAYAHFRAAIAADSGYAASYGNLAVLYREAGMPREAELLLHQALLLADPADVPLHTLHQLLTEQGRTAEARLYERAMQSVRERDPYHWIEIGLRHLDGGELHRAIDALEHARSISNGFDEVHRYLAVAYWRAGDAAKARQELALLAGAGDEAGVAKLQRKIKGARPQAQ